MRISGIITKVVTMLIVTCFLSIEAHSQLKSPTMQRAMLNEKKELEVLPSTTSSKNDFDFLLGTHKVHHKKLKSRLSNCTEWVEFEGTHSMQPILRGMGNIENLYMTSMDGNPLEGMSLRLFNPTTRLWSIYWANSELGILDVPVVGSFDKNIGHFYAKDHFNGKDIVLQFQWDVRNADIPVWSQAFSVDEGKTWEWNWYMYLSKDVMARHQEQDVNNQNTIGVIELRNYVLRRGMRDDFINYFEEHFIQSQNEIGGYILGQYRVKGADDNFSWIRGFSSMETRSRFLPEFYNGSFWNQHKGKANSMLANNDNVYLLKPLTWSNKLLHSDNGISAEIFKKHMGIAVIDYYVANSKLEKLIEVFEHSYMPLLWELGLENCTLWISELTENDFPRLPVFQDKNLLVAITLYKSEEEYLSKRKQIDTAIGPELKDKMTELVTSKSSSIIYPTKRTLSN